MRNFFRLTLIAVSFILTACSITPRIGDHPVITDIEAIGQNSRIRHLVLHYTSADTPTSLRVLSQKNVSSHYLITDETPPRLYRLVDENQRAWHAGVSQWYQYQDLNTSSIGIEIVNAGKQAEGQWTPYTAAQIELLITLAQDIIQRHGITPANIVGHSDIAPQRKIDPGPLFPWEQLATHGIGRWYNAQQALQWQQYYLDNGLPSYLEIQQLLKKAGYAVPEHGQWDRASQNVLAAFQMHYRPSRYDGLPDAQTLGILKALRE